MLYTLDARYALRKQEAPSDADSVRAEAQRLDHVRSPGNTAIHVNLKRPTGLLARRRRSRQACWVVQERLGDTRGPAVFRTEEVRGVFADLEQDIEGGPGRIELPATVVRDQNPRCAVLVR